VYRACLHRLTFYLCPQFQIPRNNSESGLLQQPQDHEIEYPRIDCSPLCARARRVQRSHCTERWWWVQLLCIKIEGVEGGLQVCRQKYDTADVDSVEQSGVECRPIEAEVDVLRRSASSNCVRLTDFTCSS